MTRSLLLLTGAIAIRTTLGICKGGAGALPAEGIALSLGGAIAIRPIIALKWWK